MVFTIDFNRIGTKIPLGNQNIRYFCKMSVISYGQPKFFAIFTQKYNENKKNKKKYRLNAPMIPDKMLHSNIGLRFLVENVCTDRKNKTSPRRLDE